jgi:predicted MFS family arabinose efflux permease
MSYTVVGKSLKFAPKAIGVASGGFAVASSLGIVIADTLGSYLFNLNDRAPFALCGVALAILIILIVFLRACN